MSDESVESDELMAVELRETEIQKEEKRLKETNESLEKRLKETNESLKRVEKMVSNMVEDIEKIKQVAGKNYDDIGLLAQKI